MARALIQPNEQVYTTPATGETRYRLNIYTGVIESYLIYPQILIENAAKIIQVVPSAQDEFDVAVPLFWVQCANTVTADEYYYNTVTGDIEQIVPVP